MMVKAVAGTWLPVVEEHRCTMAHCPEPAVIYRIGTARHWDRKGQHQFRRFLCHQHLEAYQLELRHGRVYYRLGWPRTVVEEHERRVRQRSRA